MDSNRTDETTLPAAVSGAVQDLAPFGASLVEVSDAAAVPEPADGHGARCRPPAVDKCQTRHLRQRVGSPDGAGTVVRAPGDAAACSMDSSWFSASESPTNITAAKLAVSDSDLLGAVEEVPDSIEEALDFVEHMPDTVEEELDSVEDVEDAIEEVPGVDVVQAIQAIQYMKKAKTLQALIPAVHEAFLEYSLWKAN